MLKLTFINHIFTLKTTLNFTQSKQHDKPYQLINQISTTVNIIIRDFRYSMQTNLLSVEQIEVHTNTNYIVNYYLK